MRRIPDDEQAERDCWSADLLTTTHEASSRFRVRPLAESIGVAWLMMAALILVTANEVAIPLDFVLRPLAIALIPSIVIGLLVSPLGQLRVPAAAGLSILVLTPALWPAIVALAAVELATWWLQRWPRLARGYSVGRFTLVATLVVAMVSTIRLAPLATDYLPTAYGSAGSSGPPIYLVLVDGYPRLDSLAQIGIDNTDFVAELEARGFDHYPTATSSHQWTHLTLQALMAGDPEGIPDDPGSRDEGRTIRASLQLPSGYVAIDPPVGHVVMRGGAQVSAGGINDFEIGLIGASMVGALAPQAVAPLIADGLRFHFERSLELMVASSSRHTFVHVLPPHPPFIYADGISACWPRCSIFDVTARGLEISKSEWAEQMDVQLAAVNAMLLEAVDKILTERRDAVIVLFSDHGGRMGLPGDEVHHSFLAARTPGNARLFDNEPHPHAVLRVISEAYP
jgi:hypothetical protein